MTSFIHVADVHLDRPLNRIQRLDSSAAARLQQASRESFAEVIETAICREVDALLIAGDLFDGPVRDASAALWVESQFKRLARESIPVVLIRGNHDSLSGAGRVTHWPEGVHEFGTRQASTLRLDQCGLAVHGQSFGSRAESADLAANYPQPETGYFNIGLLHTSLAGNSGHDTYAPTSLSVLQNSGYDYWALGHIHARSADSLSDRCFVGYSGNTQGQSIRETGAKGCLYVEVADGGLSHPEFVATDRLRWEHLQLDASNVEYLRDLEDVLLKQVAELCMSNESHPLALRVTIVGATSLHAELSRPGTIDRLSENFAERLAELGEVWLEAVKLQSLPIPTSSASDSLVPIQYIGRVVESARHDPLVREEMELALEQLYKRARHELSEYGWSAVGQDEAAQFDRFLAAAENMLASRLLGEDA